MCLGSRGALARRPRNAEPVICRINSPSFERAFLPALHAPEFVRCSTWSYATKDSGDSVDQHAASNLTVTLIVLTLRVDFTARTVSCQQQGVAFEFGLAGEDSKQTTQRLFTQLHVLQIISVSYRRLTYTFRCR